ncbi:YybH family protein [Dactylosporangium sp. CS-033363]|uniref:YybH family protein n=1 Tax=Dactylosporangium sp. CS-033363 TaxID=3239935 RepID=UPI003D901C28
MLQTVLEQWKSAVNAHDPRRVAALFTDEAIFQGLHQYSVGPDGVAAYYEAQPIGLTAAYEILETRHLADDLLLGYLAVEFTRPDRTMVKGYLSVLLRRGEERWFIDHYQLSQLG